MMQASVILGNDAALSSTAILDLIDSNSVPPLCASKGSRAPLPSLPIVKGEKGVLFFYSTLLFPPFYP